MRRIFLLSFLTCLFLFLSPKSVSAALLINEFASDTAGTTTDPDWVEVYNSGPDTVNLSLYRIRDNSTTNKKDLSGTLAPNSFATFDFTNKLDKPGDVIKLLLIADETNPLDRVAYGTAGTDVTAPLSGQSAGRSIDGAGKWIIFQTPTKGSANSTTQTFNLSPGLNLIGLTVDRSWSLPLRPRKIMGGGTQYLADNFLQDLNQAFMSSPSGETGGGNTNTITSISRFRNSNYEVHLYQNNDGDNFPIEPGEGYFIISTAPGNVSLSGPPLSITSLNIAKGWSTISFPKIPSNVSTAEDLLQAFKTQGVDVRIVSTWTNGTFAQHTINTQNNNFLLISGNGYFLRNYGTGKIFSLP